MLRIEDTDQKRFVKGAEKYLIDSLNWCGINFDESIVDGGDFGHTDNLTQKLYKPYAEQLVKSGFAYYAFDTPAQLDSMREKIKKQVYLPSI